jgi:hypothetical protein
MAMIANFKQNSPRWAVAAAVLLMVLSCTTLTDARSTVGGERPEAMAPDSKLDANGRIVDEIDYPFVNDPQVIGTWKSVDFVRDPGDFQPGTQSWKGDLFLKELIILENGRTFKPWRTWTKGLIFHSGDRTAAAYKIEDMGGKTYMFFQWKSGDYVIRHQEPAYYVLEKVSADTGELGRGWARLPSDVEFGRQLPALVEKLNINKATLEDVIAVFGEPAQYLWGKESFPRYDLPVRYIMVYPAGFSIFMSEGRIVELRFRSQGYTFQDNLRVGSTLAEVLEFFGQPASIRKGGQNDFVDGVLYKDIGGRKGECYYARRDKDVRMFFRDDKVSALFVTRVEAPKSKTDQ